MCKSKECPVVPNPSRAVIIRDQRETVTEAGIVLPETGGSKIKMNSGVVVAMGSKSPEFLSVGCRVTFSSYGGSEIEIAGKRYLLIHFDDIYSRLNTDEKVEEIK